MKLKALFFVMLAVFAANLSMGQEKGKKITISGIITDVNKNPVSGAVIVTDGIKSSRVTDRKGKYKININASAKKIGILSAPPLIIEEPINGRTTINFILDTSKVSKVIRQTDEYGEEEVSIGYGTEKRKNLTTSVSKIDARKERYASYNSIYDLLRGEIAGVQVDGKSIRIRAASSQLASNEPLFVVDGVPVSSLDGILPQMVRSIEVLKGSAASIYGSRGSNGVIIISTSDPKKSK